MKLSFDQTTDYSFRELHKFLKKASVIPEYVKEYSDKTDYTSLPKEAFADQYNRAFPKHTKEATYLSNVHFVNKKAELEKKYNKSYISEVSDRLNKSAELFGITEDIKAYNQSLNTKEANDYSEKVVYEAELNGTNLPLFTYKTAEELKLASEQFAKDYRNIPFEWRKDICESFVSHAKEAGLEELPDIVCKYAGLFYPSVGEVKNELFARAHYSKEAVNKDVYAKLAESVEGLESIEDFMKIAEVCYWMERQEGVYDNVKTAARYGDPVDRIFSLSIEKVADELNSVKLGNEYYSLNDLQNIKPEIYKQAFGIDVDNNDKYSLVEVLPTMPYSDVALFKELSGLQPIN